MWFATPNGLSALPTDHWQTYAAKDGLPSEDVNCLLEDSQRRAVGRNHGGPRLPRFQWVSGARRSAEPPCANKYWAWRKIGYGWLWMATSNHVLRVNRDKLLRGTLAEGDIREYGLADGLRGVEGVKRHRSVVTDPLRTDLVFLESWDFRGRSGAADQQLRARYSCTCRPFPRMALRFNCKCAFTFRGGRKRITFGYAGTEPLGSRARSFSLSAGGIRSRLERTGRTRGSRLHESALRAPIAFG